MNRTAIKWGKNPLLATLLMVAFCTRALIPIGFMPGPGGLILCDGYAAMSGAKAPHGMSHEMAGMAGMDMSGMDMPGMDSHPVHDDGASKHGGLSLCPFAAAATAMASGHAALAVTELLPPVARKIELPSLPFVPRTALVPSRLPRGPPMFA